MYLFFAYNIFYAKKVKTIHEMNVCFYVCAGIVRNNTDNTNNSTKTIIILFLYNSFSFDLFYHVIFLENIECVFLCGRWSYMLLSRLTGMTRTSAVNFVWHHIISWSTDPSITPLCLSPLVSSTRVTGLVDLMNQRHVSETDVHVRAGSPLGCAMRVSEGAVPNEHGTWLYGRAGWCDGLQVDPWRTDITSQVQQNTMTRSWDNSVTYYVYCMSCAGIS